MLTVEVRNVKSLSFSERFQILFPQTRIQILALSRPSHFYLINEHTKSTWFHVYSLTREILTLCPSVSFSLKVVTLVHHILLVSFALIILVKKFKQRLNWLTFQILLLLNNFITNYLYTPELGKTESKL